MLTVGYGDITPKTPLLKVFTVIAILISSGIFGYSINRIGSILHLFYYIPAPYADTLSLINSYMNKRKITKDLQFRVRKYLEYLLETRGVMGKMMNESDLH